STDNINQTYVVNAGTKAADGQWQLRVKDMVSRDTGTIDSWSITFN
ncbi:MAG: proprotein convertase P-domain-containing protein, partial [Alteromonadaceae bacterium]|nr:proprotein convertase P-domain-containing protein [Alteromonadaceae bacterium]